MQVEPGAPRDAVEAAMSVTTNLYVRFSLPLSQAREAMLDKGVKVSPQGMMEVGVLYIALCTISFIFLYCNRIAGGGRRRR